MRTGPFHSCAPKEDAQRVFEYVDCECDIVYTRTPNEMLGLIAAQLHALKTSRAHIKRISSE